MELCGGDEICNIAKVQPPKRFSDFLRDVLIAKDASAYVQGISAFAGFLGIAVPPLAEWPAWIALASLAVGMAGICFGALWRAYRRLLEAETARGGAERARDEAERVRGEAERARDEAERARAVAERAKPSPVPPSLGDMGLSLNDVQIFDNGGHGIHVDNRAAPKRRKFDK